MRRDGRHLTPAELEELGALARSTRRPRRAPLDRLTVRLPARSAWRVQRAALEAGVTVGEWCRRVLERELERVVVPVPSVSRETDPFAELMDELELER